MNLQFLTGGSTESTDPNFDNSAFEEKFNNGWLKSYYYGVILLFVANLANALNNLKNGIYFMDNPMIKSINQKTDGTWLGTYDYYNTWFFGISLLAVAAVALRLAYSLFLQIQAIRLRSLEKQEAAIENAFKFIDSQAWAAGFNFFFALFSTPISKLYTINAGIVVLAVGIGYKFLACNVKNIMLGKAEESFKFNKSAYKRE